jgi:hypothetical protein
MTEHQLSEYTFHSFKRTSATTLAENGASDRDLQNAGGWKDVKTARLYVQSSVNTKTRIASQLVGASSSSSQLGVSSSSSQMVASSSSSSSSSSSQEELTYSVQKSTSETTIRMSKRKREASAKPAPTQVAFSNCTFHGPVSF